MIATATKGSVLQERFPEVVGLMVVGGFALTLGELLLMGHTEKIQTLAVVMTAVGMLAALAGLVVAPGLRKVLAGVLIVVAASGLFGTYEHLEEAAEHREKAARQELELAQQGGVVAAHEGKEGKHEEKQGVPPLAPLSLSGLALLGSLGLVASKR